MAQIFGYAGITAIVLLLLWAFRDKESDFDI